MPAIQNVKRPRDGPMDAYRTYKKLGINVPDRLQEIVQSPAASPTSTSSADLSSFEEDSEAAVPSLYSAVSIFKMNRSLSA